MPASIMGKKLGMTQIFREDGTLEGVTAVQAGPCKVVQVKTTATDGYNAVQIGFGEAKRLHSAQKGHLKGLGMFRYLREFRVTAEAAHAVGDVLDVSQFNVGDKVEVVGISKGKGFAGGVKRHGFAGGPKTHGQSDRHRAPGALGSTTTPGRVWKGLKMAGRMGGERVTVRGLEVRATDKERNILLIKGSVPGNIKGILLIRKSGSEK